MNAEWGDSSALAVYLHGRRIGVINRFAGERHLFAFEQDYVDDPDRATLSLSFKARSGTLITSLRPVTVRVPPFFSNLLPEGHLRGYLAERAGVKPEREFFLLSALGEDLPGAVTVKPLTRDESVDRQSRERRVDSASHGTSVLRFSLAGVQLKFSAILAATGGLTIPANGLGGTWIVKLPSSRFPAVPENEFVMLAFARTMGMPVPEIRLVPVGEILGLPRDIGSIEGKALAVRRFDRAPDGSKIHMEDFAQVFGLFPDRKYQRRSYANIAAVLWAEAGPDDAFEFVRRLVFSVLIGNADMHLKNWSLCYPDGRTPVLSPVYDFVSTIPYLPVDRLALGFGGSRRLDRISAEQVRRFADTAGLPVSPVWMLARETVEQAVRIWVKLDAGDLLPASLRAAITRQIETVAGNMEG